MNYIVCELYFNKAANKKVKSCIFYSQQIEISFSQIVLQSTSILITEAYYCYAFYFVHVFQNYTSNYLQFIFSIHKEWEI